MNLAPIIAEIRTVCTVFKAVGGVAEFDAAADGVKTTPACYVVPLSEQAEDNQQLYGNLQRVNVDFGVCIIVKHARAAEEMLNDLESLRSSVSSALIGKTLTTESNSMPIQFTGGQVLDFQPGLMWWQDGYRTAHHIHS